MRELYTSMQNALNTGRNLVLCSVTASSGSTPRGEGANMAVYEDGETAGTIGGGAVEYEAAKTAMEVHSLKESTMRSYDLSEDQKADLGMICGGAVTVSFRFLPADDDDAKAFVEREIEIYNKSLKTCYIFGGGHVSQALVPVISKVNFKSVVYEDRERFADLSLFPGADAAILGSFMNITERVEITEDDYIVIVTRGHQADYEVLEQSLRTPATYIGMIGSRHKFELTRKRLKEAGFNDDDIARIHNPIGLPILAETPDEIAVSITAELIRHRAERK